MDIIKRAAQELKDRVNKTSQIEKLLQESTSKDNWQAHPKTLNTIADYTNSSEEWQIISKYLWEKLYKSDKSWIVTFKTLVLIEYLLKNGSPRCIMEFKDEIYKIRKLQDFQYVEDGEDKGASVRQRSKNIVDLLTDEDKLDHERQTAKELRDKMSSVSNNNPYGGMGSNSNGGNYGSSSSSSQVSSSKYAGFSSDSYKDQKYVGKSSKDAPSFNYKSGDSYDSTEFKGLDKYRKKEEKEEAHPKKNEKTQPAALPKPVEAQKISIGQIKIQPPSGKPEVSQPVAVAAKPAAQTVDLFDDEPAKQQPQSQEGEWNWSPAPQQTQQIPTAQAQKQQTQPSFQQFQQAPQAYQQAPQTYKQPPQTFQQAPQAYQQPTQAAQYQLQQQPQYYQPTVQQQQQAIKPVQTNQVDLFQNTLPAQQATSKNTTQQDVDLFSDFQSSSQNQKKENYSKDEFDLINLGDLKKEADKKQKDKEAKTQNANEFGFSTLTTQLDQFSINPSNSNFSAPNNFTSPPQSNYSALNNLNWGQPQYVMPGYQNGMGVPGQQGYPVQGGYVQQGYGQPYPGQYVAQNNNFRM